MRRLKEGGQHGAGAEQGRGRGQGRGPGQRVRQVDRESEEARHGLNIGCLFPTANGRPKLSPDLLGMGQKAESCQPAKARVHRFGSRGATAHARRCELRRLLGRSRPSWRGCRTDKRSTSELWTETETETETETMMVTVVNDCETQRSNAGYHSAHVSEFAIDGRISRVTTTLRSPGRSLG